MPSRGPALFFGIFAGVLLVWLSLFQVSETEAAIRSQFGKILKSELRTRFWAGHSKKVN